MLKALTLTRYHIYYTLAQSKFWAAILMILSAGYINVNNIAQIVFQYDTPISFGIFALIFSDGFFVVVFPIALLFFFGNAFQKLTANISSDPKRQTGVVHKSDLVYNFCFSFCNCSNFIGNLSAFRRSDFI